MRTTIRSVALATVLGLGGLLAIGSSPALAQGYYQGGYGYSPSYGGGYGARGYYGGGYVAANVNPGYGAGYGSPQYYGGGYAAPNFNYYGNGGHDAAPHWHTTRGPYGAFQWFGSGAHDAQPHEHVASPYGGHRSYSVGPYGVTESYYPSTPYTYMPW